MYLKKEDSVQLSSFSLYATKIFTPRRVIIGAKIIPVIPKNLRPI